MAIVSVREIWDGRQATADEKFTRTYRRSFRVKTTDLKDGPALVGDAVDPSSGLSIPRLYDFYEGPSGEADFSSLCLRILPEQDPEDGYLWTVRVEYGPPTFNPAKYGNPAHPGSGGQPTQQQHPLLRPPDLKWTTAKVENTLVKDAKGKWYLTSANGAYDPPPTGRQTVLVCTYSRNEAVYDPLTVFTYVDSLNLEEFLTFQPGEAKMEDITAEDVFEGGYLAYVRVNYVIHLKPGGWIRKLLDADFYSIDVATGERVQILDPHTAAPASRPQLLDGNGQVLSSDPFTEPKYNDYDEFLQVSWAPLHLTAP